MHFQKLDLNLLVAFDTLLEEKSVSRAADRLNLSQSAMSSALSRLRDYFGDELLIPVGRRMEPTALALSLAPSVRDILQRIRTTVQTRPTFDPATAQRRFRIMTSDYLIEVLLAEVVRELAVIAPGIQLQVLPSNETSFALFLKGDVDLVIAPEEHLPNDDHPRRVLFEDSFSCIVWSGNTTVREPLTLEQWLAMSHVVVHFGRDQLTVFERWYEGQGETKGAERRVDIIAPSFGVVPHLIVGTQRVATMHTSHARLYEKLLPLRVLAPPPGFPTMRETMQWHRHLDTDPAIRWLVDLLQSFGEKRAPDSAH
jgi:LysR family transcriptional regulator, nod-box dependent transcriptional activator